MSRGHTNPIHIIPIVNDDTNDWDWDLLERTGCFAVPASAEMKEFLVKIHDRYIGTGVSENECSGRNRVHLDDLSQIIRLFILDHREKHPFDNGYGFEEINVLLKEKLEKLWKMICDHYQIKNSLTEGVDSTGIHHYPQTKNAKQGLKGHIDSTLLVCNLATGPGLEVYYEGKWHDVYIENHMVVNIGFLGHLISGLPPCIHRVKTVNYDRSVIVFSPGYSGSLNEFRVENLIRTFEECFDKLEINNEKDLAVFKDMIFSLAF